MGKRSEAVKQSHTGSCWQPLYKAHGARQHGASHLDHSDHHSHFHRPVCSQGAATVRHT